MTDETDPIAVSPTNPAAEQNEEPGEDVREEQVPVIGIGAPAGGLEALSQLLDNMPDNTGAAFVIVQHLAPTKDSALAELLSRRTRMPVNQVTDNMGIEPNTVYLIPPDKNMALMNGTLQLLDSLRASGTRHPIDYFFKSLAADLGKRAVCIIMSGTGSDGTEGARVIKANLGFVLAQDPMEAKYDGMPRSVIDAGLADHVLATADIPEQIVKYLRHIPQQDRETPNDTVGLLPKIIPLIRDATGNDFSAYKENTLLRRIARRMAIQHMSDAAQYVGFLQEDPKECTTLFKELLINVTSLFRDAESFEVLKSVLKGMLEHKPRQEEIRAWVVGCSTGEEAYSIAIILRELLSELGIENKVQIFGTDLDSDAIDIARGGVYRKNIADDITPERLKRFFTWKDDVYHVNADILEMLVFANHNLTKEPPFLRMDLVSVRNLLIYLKADLQKRLMPLFHYSLRESGVLFLSPSETVGEFSDAFEEVDRKWKFYRSRPYRGFGHAPQFPPLLQAREPRHGQSQNQETRTDEISGMADGIVLSNYAPPYVAIDNADNVIYFRGDTGKYLKLPDGKATINVVELARRGLASHLDLAIRSARREKSEARRVNITLADSPEAPAVDILVRPVPAQGQATECFIVVFKESSHREAILIENAGSSDGKKPKRGKSFEKDRHILELQLELKRSRENLQASMEEMETSNEELKSSNEELLSSNEELQSTNEELETSCEELRSLNEELSGLNAENQERIEQLYRAREDMRNLLDTINVATVFLDLDLQVKSFTPAVSQLFNIRKGDVGRPLSDISHSLDYPDLLEIFTRFCTA
jgi:two-component system, chemotaxis family, CheB/CheR fusion protein